MKRSLLSSLLVQSQASRWIKTLYVYLVFTCIVFLCGDIAIDRRKSSILVGASRTYLPKCTATITDGENLGHLNLLLAEVEQIYVGGTDEDPETVGYVWAYTGESHNDTTTILQRIITAPGTANTSTTTNRDLQNEHVICST